METLPPQRLISAACELDLAQYGDTFRGAGYTRSADEARERYALMLEVVRERDEPVSVLDFGCGLAHMLDHIEGDPTLQQIVYSGLDISSRYLSAAKARHPDGDFILMDVLASDDALPDYDYVVMNGIFNYRGALDEKRMLRYLEDLTSCLFKHCRRGLAFNVMSTVVDWQRDDLFHLSFDTLAGFVGTRLSRYFVIRHDYGAYEYTTYVYREMSRLGHSHPAARR